MQIMHDSTPARLKHLLPDPAGAGSATLPTANVRQGMFDSHALPHLRPSLRRLLTFMRLLQQGCIGMNTDATARRACGAALPPYTARPRGGGNLHPLPGRHGQRPAPLGVPAGGGPSVGRATVDARRPGGLCCRAVSRRQDSPARLSCAGCLWTTSHICVQATAPSGHEPITRAVRTLTAPGGSRAAGTFLAAAAWQVCGG